MWALAEEVPSFQATNPATDGPRGTAQLVAIHLGHDLHDPPIDRVALTGQLRQLPEQHLKTLSRGNRRAEGCGRGHDIIIAEGSDKSLRFEIVEVGVTMHPVAGSP